MTDYNTKEVTAATAHLGWSTLFESKRGTKVAVILRDEPVLAEYVGGKDFDDDSDYEQNISVVIRIGDQFFEKAGNADSHGEDHSWYGSLSEVRPVEVVVTKYETIRR